MKLRYWLILFALLLGILGLVMRFHFFPGHRPDSKIKTPSHSIDSEKHMKKTQPAGSPPEKQDHDDHKHGEGEEKEAHHDDHKDDHGKENEAHHDDHKNDHGKEEGHDDHEESEEESVGGVGKGKAVTAADEHDGIQLSSKAIDAMGIKTAAYKNGPIPAPALVRYQENIGVYRLRDGWLKLIPVKVKSMQGDSATILTADLEPSDQIVIVGTGLVRAAELDAFSGEVGHSH